MLLAESHMAKLIQFSLAPDADYRGCPLETSLEVGLKGERLVAGPAPMYLVGQRGFPFPWAHHLRVGPKGSGAS